jgi:hypothetical protein
MKKVIILLAVALAIPTSAALAKGSPTRGKSAPKVMYVLKGTLWSYSAASTTADGQITIHVAHSNFHGRALKDQYLTFGTTATTRVTFVNGATQISDGATGLLKFRAPLRVTGGGTLAATLPAMAKALHIIANPVHS